MQHYRDQFSDDEKDGEEEDYENQFDSRGLQKANPKNELANRLYNKGASTKLLPSVSRPETAGSTARPLSAKVGQPMFGQAKYQSQPALLNPASSLQKNRTQQQARPGAPEKQSENVVPQGKLGQTTTAKFFGQTLNDGFKNQQQEEQIPITITYGDSKPHPLLGTGDNSQPRLRQVQSHQTLRPNTSQSAQPSLAFNRYQNLQSASSTRLGAVQGVNRPITSQTAVLRPFTSNQLAATQRLNPRPPTVDSTLTQMRIDDLTKKKEIDPRYLHNATGRVATANLNTVPEENEDAKKKALEAEGAKGPVEEPFKRPPSSLDKYIELILKNVTNIDEFIYLVRNSKNPDDPYDLKVKDYAKLKKKNRKEYYTISMKGLCHYVNGKPVEFISLAYWLKERETYDKIKSLSFFVKFRKWKTLKMWKRNIIKYKTANCAKALEEKLFILHPVLAKSLLIHRDFCMKMESLRFINLTQQVEIQDLQEFSNGQEKQRKYVNEEIQRFSKIARDNIRDGFKNCLDTLRKKKNTAVMDEDFTKRNDNQPNMVRLKESAYENLGFPDNMSYERRAELRRECSRFIRFSYLVDFLALESLSSIFTQSIRDLIEELDTLNNEIDVMVLKGDQEHIYRANKAKEPLFSVKLDFNEEQVTEDEIDRTELQRFDIGSSEETKNPYDFDILGHIYLEEDIKGPNGEELPEEEVDKIKAEIEENRKYYKLVPRDIERKWLLVNPNLETILTRILTCFQEGMNSLQAFERWSKHDELTPYARVLEEWDDMVGDDWDIPESNFLNPNSWIKVSAFNEYGKRVRELLKVSFDRGDNYLHTFRDFLVHYWKNKQIEYDKFTSELLGQPIETMQSTLALIQWQKEHFEKEIPHSADIGLLRIDSKKVRERITPSPTIVHEKLQEIMPVVLRNRIQSINDWLTESIGRLSDITINIDQFVKQTLALKEISKKFPAVRETIMIISQLYNIFKEQNIEVTKDDDQNLIKTIKKRDHLNEVIIKAEDGAERNLERFAKDVKNNLIPKLSEAVANLEALATQEKYLEKDMDMDVAIEELEKLSTEFFQLDENSKTYNRYEETLGLAITRFENVDNLKNQLLLRRDLWKSLKEWKALREKWITGKFLQIETEEIKTKADYYTKIISKCSKVLIPNPILDQLRKMVYDFKDTMPVVLALRNKYLEAQHIGELKEKLGEDFELHEDLTLNELIEMNVVQFQKEIQEISTQATQEAILTGQLNIIHEKWKTVEFILKRYKEESLSMREMYIIGEVDEIKELLDESLANLNNILGSRYLKYQKDMAQRRHKDLMQVQDVLDAWLACQRNWIYLENIFASPDIQRQLMNEAAQFKRIDQSFKDTMKKTSINPNVMKQTVGNPGILEKFNKHNEVLSKIQKELENYLEHKREEFPRFYFLSNDELLEILANAANPQAVQPHLKKCFDNIYKLDFGDDPKSVSVLAMISAEGERVPLAKPTIAKRGEVEAWLRNLQENMVETLRKLLKAGWRDLEKDRKKWVLDHPGQVVATISQVSWCSQTRMFINMNFDDPNALDNWLQLNKTQLEQLTELVKSNLTPIKHKIIVALITTDVHARDIVEYLRDENVSSESDFSWQKQLRYYWEDDNEDHVVIRQVNSKLDYGYEYMGATSRLVITPLTDRCWITITGALNLKLGAAPAGPAGTGKTESTKDLAKGLGMLCIVFNCSEQIDYKMMGRLFSGLAQQGAWACLDEFNRIDIEVLSVVAQQLLSIRQAQLQNSTRFFFIDHEITLKSTCGVFITMNPGYAGRTELPDNLKVLFRPVSMMIPNYGLIAKVMLYAEGFKNADELADKMVTLYKLSSEQLSQQDHYDFGMRAVKSVLVMAGTLKRAPENANTSEDELLIRAMRDSNIPKFLKDDIPLFQAIVKDLFPKVEVRAVDYGELEQAVTHTIKEMKLQVVDRFITKVIQLFETFNVRFGVMLVGLTGSGKTTCYQVLKAAMSHLRKIGSQDQRFQLVKDYCLNPKSISMGELFGEVHPLTKEWNDGLASSIMRMTANEEGVDKKWVVFDGPVDALWIENMNTVLDDNMMLCLSNGQRIKLRAEMRMLFEVQDLAVASPATVSRCGMVYMTFEDLSWRPYVKSWLATALDNEVITNPLKNHIWDLFQSCVDAGLDKIRHTMTELVTTTDLQLVKSLTNLLEVFLSEEYGLKKEANQEQKQRYINYIFAYAFTWSFGATVPERYHDRMNDFIRDKFQQILYPNIDSVYSFFLDTNDLTFKLWTEKVPEFEYVRDKAYFEIVVPTPDTTKYSHYLEWLLHFEKPVFLTGGSGVGKSLIAQSLLAKIQEPRRIDTISLIFSAQTSSPVVQSSIEDKLQKYNKSTLGPRFNRRNVIFIDDINMPTKEEYGAQPPIELLRQLTDKKGFYDRKTLDWKNVEKTIILACAAPPGGGRSALTPRFVRHFHLLCLPQPSDKTLSKIFSSILNGFLNIGFQEPIKRLGEIMVQSTIEIYARILKEKPPIPSKFHYTFNLRDVSKVVQGILMCKSSVVYEADQMIRLWVHESSRVFHDRLVNDEDRLWFNKLLAELLERTFRFRFEYEELFNKNIIYFSDILRLESDGKEYEEIKDMTKLQRVLEDKLDDYNLENTNKMNLVFFRDCIEHVMRISRILRQPRGSAMLVGVGGSGKQSLTRLSTFLREFILTRIEITKGYGAEQFRENIREMMLKAGVEGKHVVFLFTDTQIINETFLEDINNILNSGEVPNLWEEDQKKNIIDELTALNQKKGRINEPDTIYRTFIEEVRNNLHIVLCMSPIGGALRDRCRKFPSLVDCCTIDWFSAWPKDALQSVSTKILAEIELPSKEIATGLTEMCPEVHLSAVDAAHKFDMELKRKVYTTPKSYLDMIHLFLKALGEKREELNENHRRLSSGITKLRETNEGVAELQIKLTELQPQLEEQNIKTEKALKAVEADTQKANEQQAMVEKQTEDVNRQAMEIKITTEQAMAELREVEPELKAAEEALKNLNEKDFVELKSLNNPPKMVATVMDAVSVILNEKGEGDWMATRKLLGDVKGFKDRLLTFNTETLADATLNKLRKYLLMPEFVPEIIRNKSRAAELLCSWCRTINNFKVVEKKVEPKKRKAAEMKEKLDEAEKTLMIKQNELNEVQANVAKLRKELNDTIAFQKSLAEQTEKCKIHLIRAEKLQVLLADEGKRWEETVKVIEGELHNVVGDVFLASAIISYHGPFTGPYRAEMLQYWANLIKEKNIPVSENFTLVNTLGNSLLIRDWNLCGLPTDTLSQDNSLLATKGYRWPLMIDPQLQALKWIKNMEGTNLKVMKFTDGQFAQNMKSAIMFGYPVLIQDIDLVLDPSIDSVLGKQYFKDNDGRLVIKFGDADIDYDMNFKLFMTTKIPNPDYLPEVFIKATVINFNITSEGLEDQLLGDVVKNERPEIEAQRDENIVKLANFNKELKRLENQILKMLAESEGAILDNVQLIDSLENSKITATTIGKELADSKILEQQIEKTRSQYTDVSVRGAILYFVIADLSLIDPMYQYSLQYIKRLFNSAMEATERTENLEERLQLLIDKITKTIYVNVCRGLFEAHKIIYSFLIAISIKKKAKQLDELLWRTFLRGAGLVDKEKQPANPDPKLIGKNEWDLAYYLDLNFEKFKGTIEDLTTNIEKWNDFANSGTVVEDPLPGIWEEKLTFFEKLLFLKVIRPEKLMFAIQTYVIHDLGSFFVEGLNIKMDSVYEESDKKTPIIFVLSQGADPTSQIMRLAKDRNMTAKLIPISLGQGQGDHAKSVIEKARQDGLWVLLQNCHLARTWMPSLELIIDDIAANEYAVHDDFRIFLTSMPASYFPVSILQNGIKLTTEPPRGLKNNLKRSYLDVTQEFLDDCSKKEAMHKLMFGLAFFHGVIQERKKFGPLGWNIRYEFNDSDLETSQQVLQMLLTEQEIIPWDALLFVTGDINYGGRVTDDWDRRCLISILKRYYTPEILEEKYYLADNDIYYVPPVDTVESYRQYIETLPLTDDPEVFGMHENANIIYQTQESEKILKTILNIQPRVATGSAGKSTDETVSELAQTILDDLPESLKKEEGNAELFKEEKGLIPPLSTVLLQEMARFNRLLNVITNSLKNLQKAIKGIVLMSAELDSMYSSLLNNQVKLFLCLHSLIQKVPKIWEKAAYPSLKPLASWIKDLSQRVEFMRNWLISGNQPGYWLSGFFFPQGFITGVLQTHARKYEVAIDKLKFSFRILDQTKEQLHNPPNVNTLIRFVLTEQDGVYVYGLYLEGAVWDKRKKMLTDPIPGEMHFQMPAIHFNPTDNYESKPQDYNCPVYKTSARAGTLSTTGHSTNFIIAVDIPTPDFPPETWVLRGTALLCQLND